jgi:hypothetical protein
MITSKVIQKDGGGNGEGDLERAYWSFTSAILCRSPALMLFAEVKQNVRKRRGDFKITSEGVTTHEICNFYFWL